MEIYSKIFNRVVTNWNYWICFVKGQNYIPQEPMIINRKLVYCPSIYDDDRRTQKYKSFQTPWSCSVRYGRIFLKCQRPSLSESWGQNDDTKYSQRSFRCIRILGPLALSSLAPSACSSWGISHFAVISRLVFFCHVFKTLLFFGAHRLWKKDTNMFGWMIYTATSL